MDNSNNPNSLNNPNPVPTFDNPPAGPQPISNTLTTPTSATSAPDPINTPLAAQSNPVSAWPPNISTPTPIANTNPTWPPPVNPLPTTPPAEPTLSQTPSFPQENNSSPWPNIPSGTPTQPSIPSTFTPPTPAPDNTTTAPNLSPLDNPWSTPLQTPNINGSGQSSQPSWIPDSTNQTTSNSSIPSPQPITPITPEVPANMPQTEPAPTDLSHLISNNPEGASSGGLNISDTPATLVVPTQVSGPAPEIPTVPTENHKGVPKWLIGVAVGLLILVAGASAYFILGVGQNKQSTTSIPAEVSKTTVNTPPPIATPTTPPDTTTATGSANFGELQGSGTPQATSSATNSIDLLKQRQQQAK